MVVPELARGEGGGGDGEYGGEGGDSGLGGSEGGNEGGGEGGGEVVAARPRAAARAAVRAAVQRVAAAASDGEPTEVLDLVHTASAVEESGIRIIRACGPRDRVGRRRKRGTAKATQTRSAPTGPRQALVGGGCEGGGV